MSSGDWLDVAAWEPRSVVNGPGERFVLWVQGCPFRCPGCYNPDFLPSAGGRRLTVRALADLVLSVPGIEGVTYSGGEPMAHARALALLSAHVRAAGRSVFCFSGYRIEELRRSRNPSVGELLGLIDVLVDGRYAKEQAAALPWRGSRNQRVHFLSDRYRDLEPDAREPARDVELVVGRDAFVATGIFDVTLIERLQAAAAGGPRRTEPGRDEAPGGEDRR